MSKLSFHIITGDFLEIVGLEICRVFDMILYRRIIQRSCQLYHQDKDEGRPYTLTRRMGEF